MKKITAISTKSLALVLAGAFFFGLMITCAKLASQQLNNDMVVFGRFFVSFIYISTLISVNYFQKKPISLKTQHLGEYLVLSGSMVATVFLLFYSIKYIRLLDATLLNTTYPLFMPLLTMFVLKYKTPRKTWFAIILGFVGIAFILNPTASIFEPAALMALASGLTATIAIFTLRQVSKQENPNCILFYFFLFSALITGIIAIFNWQPIHSFKTVSLLIGIGVFGATYQGFLVRAIHYAQARIVSCLMYVNVVFSGFFGWVFWHEIPDRYDWLGVTLVCISAIFILYNANGDNLHRTFNKLK